MFEKIKIFVARLQTMSLKAMFMMIDKINKESKVPKFLILIDMIWCAFRYGVGYLEYRVFGWVYIKGKKRKTFMRIQDNLNVCKKLNDKKYTNIFEDKIEFNKRFKKYIKREYLDLKRASFNEFKDFCKEKKLVFAKEVDGFGGIGAKKINLSNHKKPEQLKKLYKDLKSKKLFVLEDCVIQNKQMDKLSPRSINTIRIVTVLSKGKPHIIYSLIRMGDGTKDVDNISSGGMYAPVAEDGTIKKPAFCDKTGELYKVHPLTKTRIPGFKIPNYDQVLELVRKAALEVPQVGYVGWDVAIAKTGPLIIEGNTLPGYDMPQNFYHLGKEKNGILQKFQELQIT